MPLCSLSPCISLGGPRRSSWRWSRRALLKAEIRRMWECPVRRCRYHQRSVLYPELCRGPDHPRQPVLGLVQGATNRLLNWSSICDRHGAAEGADRCAAAPTFRTVWLWCVGGKGGWAQAGTEADPTRGRGGGTILWNSSRPCSWRSRDLSWCTRSWTATRVARPLPLHPRRLRPVRRSHLNLLSRTTSSSFVSDRRQARCRARCTVRARISEQRALQRAPSCSAGPQSPLAAEMGRESYSM